MSVSLQQAIGASIRGQLLAIEIPSLGQRCVKTGRCVPFAEDESVAVNPPRIGRIVSHNTEIERHQDVHFRQRTAGVTTAGAVYHFQAVTT